MNDGPYRRHPPFIRDRCDYKICLQVKNLHTYPVPVEYAQMFPLGDNATLSLAMNDRCRQDESSVRCTFVLNPNDEQVYSYNFQTDCFP